jgi:hypothetical protein
LACIALNAGIVTPDSANMKTVAPFRARQTSAPAPPAREDATLEFASETKSADAGGLPVVIKIRKPAMIALGAAFGVLMLAGVVAAWTLRTPAAPSMGSLSVESDPAGAEVRINNAVRGTTPLTLNLAEGRYSLIVQRGANTKQLNVEIAANAAKSYHIAWAAAAPAASIETGSLSIASDPPGSTVTVDGSSRGQTPLTIRDLTPGRHEVEIKSATTSYQRVVQVEVGATASLVVGGAPSTTPAWGWITLKTPFPVQVQEAGRVVGTSEIERIMLSPGNHELDFVADSLGFRQSSEVRIFAGRGAPVSLTIPRVAMNINALPWAEVFVDGTRIGDTPLANVTQSIGEHEIVFRHPQFGEKRQMVRLTLRDSLRISMDMRTK